MAFVFDPKKGLEAAQAISTCLSEDFHAPFHEAFQIAKEAGDTDIVAGMEQNFIAYQNFYNDQLVPVVKKCQAHFEEYTDIAQYINQVQTAKLNTDADVGTVKDTNYDAARNL